MIESDVTLLPEPLSPTMPSVRPCSRLKREIVDRLDDAFFGVEVGAEILNVENGWRHKCAMGRLENINAQVGGAAGRSLPAGLRRSDCRLRR